MILLLAQVSARARLSDVLGPEERGLLAELGPERVAQLRELCREALPPAPFTVEARAWAGTTWGTCCHSGAST